MSYKLTMERRHLHSEIRRYSELSPDSSLCVAAQSLNCVLIKVRLEKNHHGQVYCPRSMMYQSHLEKEFNIFFLSLLLKLKSVCVKLEAEMESEVNAALCSFFRCYICCEVNGDLHCNRDLPLPVEQGLLCITLFTGRKRGGKWTIQSHCSFT